MAQSVARQFYDQFAADDVDNDKGVRLIRSLIRKRFEDDTFDAKQEPSGKDENARKKNLIEIWSEVLCGFANAAGGVIIWGLVAKPDPISKVDKVRAENLVQDPIRLEGELRKLQGELTDPPLGNLEHRVFDAKAGGFVVSFVPEGPLKPYRQRHETGNYYYRWGDSFRVMPRHMLQAMFYPRSKPVFRIDVELSWKPETPPDHVNRLNKQGFMHLAVRLSNVGTATAKDLFFHMDDNTQQKLRRTVHNPWFLAVAAGPSYLRMPEPLHPGLPASLVSTWVWNTPLTDFPNAKKVRPACPNPRFEFSVCCENQEPQRFRAVFDVAKMGEAGRAFVVEASLEN